MIASVFIASAEVVLTKGDSRLVAVAVSSRVVGINRPAGPSVPGVYVYIFHSG